MLMVNQQFSNWGLGTPGGLWSYAKGSANENAEGKTETF